MASTTTHQHHQTIVVVVPFPAQGHLGPSMQFAHKIVSHNIPVHYVASPIHNRQIKTRTHSQSSTHIQFHDFPIPPFPSPPPDPHAPVKFPAHLQPSFDAFLHLRHPVSHLLRSLSSTATRLVLVHDPLLSSVAQDVASIPNAESYCFHSSPAFFSCLFKTLSMDRPFPTQHPLPRDLSSLDALFTPEFLIFAAHQNQYINIRKGGLLNSSRLVEGPYIDSVEAEEEADGMRTWVIGSLLPENPIPQNDQCLEWLNEQEEGSVIYVSFGTTTSMSREQSKEVAVGLEESNVRFIWVMRDADKGDIFSGEARSGRLPERFEERTKGRGMVIREWVPQLEILRHRSIGGFMSHCGWNSCLESIAMGVPVAAWPMHSDQPANAFVLTKLLEIGLIVREWARREDVVTSASVREAVRRLMVSEEGGEMRKRAQKLGGQVRESVAEGGIAHKELQSFIAHISR